jgi:hypothetical protein
MTVPYSFATATAAIPLSQLDSNFNTAITLGNTAIQLGNTVTTLNNMSLANVTITSGNVTITNVSVTTANVTTVNATNVFATMANVTTVNATTVVATTSNATTANFTDLNLTNNPTFSGGTANGVLYLNGSKVATSGTALTFDGTNLGIGTASPNKNITVATSSSGTGSLLISADFASKSIEAASYGSTVSGTLFGLTKASSQFLWANNSTFAFGTADNYGLVFVQNASEQMRLTSTGLGIGTSSPSYKLDVVQSQNGDTVSAVGNANTGGAASAQFYAGNGTAKAQFFMLGTNYTTSGVLKANVGGVYSSNSAGLAIVAGGASAPIVFAAAGTSESMRLDGTGLGIGTSSPGSKLDILNTTTAQAQFSYSSTIYGRIGRLSSGNYEFSAYENGANLLFGTSTVNGSTTERMRLDSSGNLGLGVTPSASTIAQFEGGSNLLLVGRGNAYFSNNATFNSSFKYINSAAAGQYQISGAAHYWYTAASGTAGNTISWTQAMTLAASGGLSIGTTTDAGTGNLLVAGNISLATNGTSFQWTNSGNNVAINGASGTLAFYTGTSGYSERARITSGGDLLVGCIATPSASVKGAGLILDTTGTDLYLSSSDTATDRVIWFYNPNGLVGGVTVSGSATAYNTSSDYRLKDNPQPLTGSGAFIDALKPKTWNWKADGSRGVGFIAHEVQEVSPSSVVGEKDGEQMQAMEYGSAEFIANIIAELQQLRARVALLEKGA